MGDTSYVAIRNLTIDANSEGVNVSVDAINASGGITHDVLIENCIIQGAALHQQTVGISTKSTAWNWVVRGNTIIGAGTGIYFGDSDGSAPFVNGLIEGNLFVDTIGYNMQVKHQNSYNPPAGMPTGDRRTIIRHNVFLKRQPQSSFAPEKVDGPRPNLLVDGFPDSGTGSNDLYEIYGNFFYQNHDGEALIQASGRVSIHDNVFVDPVWAAVFLTDHNRLLRLARIYNNTVYGGSHGIRFGTSARQRSSVVGNLVFSDNAISGPIDLVENNVVDAVGNAPVYVQNPSTALGAMDFYPRSGQAEGPPLDFAEHVNDSDFNVDFNGDSKADGSFRGGYAGAGANPGWQLDATLKPISSGAIPARAPPGEFSVR